MISGAQLAERGTELASIDVALEAARGGDGRLLLIEGPAGAGKTALLAAGLAAARAGGMLALDARAGEFERGLPFEIVQQLFGRKLARDRELMVRVTAGAAAPAAALITSVATPGGHRSAPVEAQHALYWLVSNLSDEVPLLLAIDDLQWADPSSQAWLLYLARRLADIPVTLICTARTGIEDGRDLLDRLTDEPVTELLTPEPLTVAAVATVLRSSLGAQTPEEACRAAHTATGGNPFLVAELARALRGLSPAGADEIDRARPESVTRAIVRRLAGTSGDARRLAGAVAILGDGAELRHAASLAGLEEHEAIAAADQLGAAAILVPGRPLRFEHPLVRAAVHDARPIQERDHAHFEAARLLSAEGQQERVVASHLLAAPAMADTWAFEQLFAAGSSALRGGAMPEAVELLTRALAEPPPAGRRAELLTELGVAESATRLAAASEHSQEAMAIAADPDTRGRAALTLALERWGSGDFEGLEELIEDAIDAAEGQQREQHLMLLAFLACGLPIGYTDSPRARAALDDAARELTGETTGECLLLGVAAFERLCLHNDPAGALELVRRALSGNRMFGGYVFNNPAVNQAIMTLIACDETEHARAALNASISSTTERGAIAMLSVSESVRCGLTWVTGELLESEASGRTALGMLADTPGGSVVAASYLTRTLVDRGALDEAASVIATNEPPDGRVSAGRNLYWSARAHLEEALGRPADAASSALVLADFPVAATGLSCVIPWRLQAAVALAATGELPRARSLLADQRPITERWGLPRARGALLRTQGLVERETVPLEQAVETLRDTPARLELARTLIDLGAMRRRANQRVAAREALREGLDLAHRCGAELLVTRAMEELSATGARPRRAVLTGVDSLTAAEHRIARLAAEGRSNPEIAQALYVSRKTVESHLGRIYQKLDVQRDGLRAALDKAAA